MSDFGGGGVVDIVKLQERSEKSGFDSNQFLEGYEVPRAHNLLFGKVSRKLIGVGFELET